MNPRVPEMIGMPELESLAKTYGKFWCTWQVDRGIMKQVFVSIFIFLFIQKVTIFHICFAILTVKCTSNVGWLLYNVFNVGKFI